MHLVRLLVLCVLVIFSNILPGYAANLVWKPIDDAPQENSWLGKDLSRRCNLESRVKARQLRMTSARNTVIVLPFSFCVNKISKDRLYLNEDQTPV